MSLIIDTLESKRSLLASGGVTENKVIEAEKELSLAFTSEYREYLLKYGIAAYNGHELTGITNSDRLNVVSVTKAEKSKDTSIPADYYVIEQTNVEEIVIWQSADGKIYYSSPNQKITYLCDSLNEYIKKS